MPYIYLIISIVFAGISFVAYDRGNTIELLEKDLTQCESIKSSKQANIDLLIARVHLKNDKIDELNASAIKGWAAYQKEKDKLPTIIEKTIIKGASNDCKEWSDQSDAIEQFDVYNSL